MTVLITTNNAYDIFDFISNFVDKVKDPVCDTDNVGAVLNDIYTYTERTFPQTIVLKYKDLKDGVPRQEDRLSCQKYIDGKEFIQWMDDKNNLMKTYIQLCWRFHGIFHGRKISGRPYLFFL